MFDLQGKLNDYFKNIYTEIKLQDSNESRLLKDSAKQLEMVKDYLRHEGHLRTLNAL
jgi:uncharacterized protein YajQ (UPF0234 family)